MAILDVAFCILAARFSCRPYALRSTIKGLPTPVPKQAILFLDTKSPVSETSVDMPLAIAMLLVSVVIAAGTRTMLYTMYSLTVKCGQCQ